ncbi:MAG: hypothetical protein ABH823_00505 [bacterium]
MRLSAVALSDHVWPRHVLLADGSAPLPVRQLKKLAEQTPSPETFARQANLLLAQICETRSYRLEYLVPNHFIREERERDYYGEDSRVQGISWEKKQLPVYITDYHWDTTRTAALAQLRLAALQGDHSALEALQTITDGDVHFYFSPAPEIVLLAEDIPVQLQHNPSPSQINSDFARLYLQGLFPARAPLPSLGEAYIGVTKIIPEKTFMTEAKEAAGQTLKTARHNEAVQLVSRSDLEKYFRGTVSRHFAQISQQLLDSHRTSFLGPVLAQMAQERENLVLFSIEGTAPGNVRGQRIFTLLNSFQIIKITADAVIVCLNLDRFQESWDDPNFGGPHDVEMLRINNEVQITIPKHLLIT